MKRSVGISVIIACLSVAYYFAIFLPHNQLKPVQPPPQPHSGKADTSKVDIEMQEKCAIMSEKLFKTMSLDPNMSGYECHYNKKLNKFFMTTEETKVGKGTIYTTKMLIDVLENKTLGLYMWHTVEGKKYWEVKPFYCTMLGELCDVTTEEYDAFVKPYMEQ